MLAEVLMLASYTIIFQRDAFHSQCKFIFAGSVVCVKRFDWIKLYLDFPSNSK